MSDRVVVMRGAHRAGRPPTALVDRPANGFVAEFIGAANLLPATVTGLGDAGTLRTAGGLSIAAAVAGVKIGEGVTAVLRPERLRLSRQTGNGAPGHAAKVHDASFAGGVWRYRVVSTPAASCGDREPRAPNRTGRRPVTVDCRRRTSG
jgi:ABC-type Fe3+/spermidine/putrescine transport system ATPase subunit